MLPYISINIINTIYMNHLSTMFLDATASLILMPFSLRTLTTNIIIQPAATMIRSCAVRPTALTVAMDILTNVL